MLKQEIDDAKRAVNTDTVQVTIGEVGNMYTSNELNWRTAINGRSFPHLEAV